MEEKKQEKRISPMASVIRRHLLSGRDITIIQALREYGCKTLPTCIRELREAGMNIERRFIGSVSPFTGKPVTFSRYQLSKASPEAVRGE